MYDAEGGAADKLSAAVTVLDQQLPHHRRQEKDVSTCDPSLLNTHIAFAPSSLPPPPPPPFPLLPPRSYQGSVSSPSCTSPHTSPLSSPQQVFLFQLRRRARSAPLVTVAAPVIGVAQSTAFPFILLVLLRRSFVAVVAVCLSPGLSSQSSPRQTSALAPAPNGRGAVSAPPDTCKIPVLVGPDLELRSSKAAAQAAQRSIGGTKDLSLVLTSRAAASDSCHTALQDDKCTRGLRYKFDEQCADMEGDAENPQDAVRMKFIQKQKLDGAGHLSRWSNREKYLVAISCLLFLTCIAFVVLAYTRDREQKGKELFLSRWCLVV
ncbi:hypothetical protein C0Q70_04046 [Pomacea canaliculata]|uniref:Uncharacterized protein n=1 Tax=Pomacea canaliculata TaxID=400727 RepID=A0A2T7PUE9_POMCA|nr:hypothetical protein C0Q70_04046 [Pomacea canaliculata]